MDIEMIEFGDQPDFSTEEKHSMLIDILREHVCTVKFKKVNGDERIMTCTLAKSFLPEQYQLTEPTNTKITSIPVFLPKEQCWRSFKVDNVVSISIDE